LIDFNKSLTGTRCGQFTIKLLQTRRYTKILEINQYLAKTRTKSLVARFYGPWFLNVAKPWHIKKYRLAVHCKLRSAFASMITDLFT